MVQKAVEELIAAVIALLIVLAVMALLILGMPDRSDNTDICRDGVLYYRFIKHGDSVAPAFNKDSTVKTCDIHQ